MNPSLFIIAIILTILCAILFLPETSINKSNKFLYKLHRIVNFRTLLIDKVLKILYIFSTITVILLDFYWKSAWKRAGFDWAAYNYFRTDCSSFDFRVRDDVYYSC